MLSKHTKKEQTFNISMTQHQRLKRIPFSIVSTLFLHKAFFFLFLCFQFQLENFVKFLSIAIMSHHKHRMSGIHKRLTNTDHLLDARDLEFDCFDGIIKCAQMSLITSASSSFRMYVNVITHQPCLTAGIENLSGLRGS